MDVQTGDRHASVRGCEHFPDLQATLHCAQVDPALLSELPARYSSCFSVCEYFDLYDHPAHICACELEAPRHVLLFTATGHTVDILNKLVDITPADVERAATAIFRAFPRVKRIRGEVKFAPAELLRPHRVRLRNDDYVIELPAALDEYRAGIGRRTRQNLNQYSNRLKRTHPDFRLEVLEKDEITSTLVEEVAAWNRERMREKGAVSIYERNPEKLEPLWKLLQSYGLALCGYMGERRVAGQLVLLVGHETWVHTVGFDVAYEDMHLGLLMAYFTVVESIARGCSRMHMLWGTPVYKQRLGAVPVPAYQVSLFRRLPYRTLWTFENWHKDEPKRMYWRAHERAKRVAAALAKGSGAASREGGERA